MERQLKPQFRIAPTPSGYLHMGNLLNFVLTASECLRARGELRLRLDDIDHTRVRPEYIEDVFRTLNWLGLDYQHGPAGPDDFKQNFSQVKKREIYSNELKKIKSQFVCECSRREVQDLSEDGSYPGTCYKLRLEYKSGKTCIRFKTSSEFNFLGICPDHAMRDFLIWSKEDLPTYQLVSVVDDLSDGITHIIRGQDLLGSSAAQAEIANGFGEHKTYQQIQWHHHQLLTSDSGEKLSKSKSDLSLKILREGGMNSAEVYQQLAQRMNLSDPQSFQRLEDFTSLPSLYKHP